MCVCILNWDRERIDILSEKQASEIDKWLYIYIYIYNWDRGRIDILLEKQVSKIDKWLFFSPNMGEKKERLLEILLHPHTPFRR